MVVKTNTNRLGDLVKWEVRREYCRTGVSYTNGTGGDISIDDPMGYPVVDNGDGTITLCVAATDGDCNALLLSDTKFEVANGATVSDLTILRYGPALVNQDLIPVTDHAAAGMTIADIVAGLASENIHTVEESDEIETQTT